MTEPRKPQPRRRPGKNTFTTKSGSTIKLNRSLGERIKASREAKARRRAAYLSTLPKNRFKRILFRLKPRELWRYWFSRDGAIMALKIFGIGIVVFFVLIVGVFAYFRKDLPNIKDISGTNIGGSITYYARDGKTVLFQDYDAVKRIPVDGKAINNNLRNATVAIEDKDFYKHGAFDIRGITRAGLHDIFGGGGTQGGSTITQQLVKLNQDWTADRTITRKVKEVILAVELEREYSKDDILTGYLNIAPYGPVEYGAQVGASDYFGEDAKDITLPQAAFLAAIPKSPNTYSPYGPYFDQNALKARTDYILDQMASQHMITKQQAADAKKVDVISTVKPRASQKTDGIKAPYFVLAAKQQLETKYGADTVKRGGWKVITTVDMNLQTEAEKVIQADRATIEKSGGDEAAFVAEDNKTGQVVALVGGVDYNDPDHGKINYATGVNISPGSTFKPYDYSTFIENNNAGAGSVLYDDKTKPGTVPGYPCVDTSKPTATHANDQMCIWDYDGGFPGAITLRYALGGSRNVPAIKAMLSAVPNDTSNGRQNSINKTINTARSLMGNPDGYECYQPGTDLSPGVDPKVLKAARVDCGGSAAIGDGAYLKLADHTNGLASIARMGQEIPQTYILKVTDASGKTINEFTQPTGKQVIHQDTAYIITDMASDPNASYLNPGSCTTGPTATCTQSGYKFQRYKGWHFAVKTGTTNFGFDGLMASWSTQYTAVTWVGYHNRNQVMHGGMEYMTEPIIRPWMQYAHDQLNMTPVNWQQPSDIKVLTAYQLTHKVSAYGDVVPSPAQDLFPSWYVQPKGNTTTTVDIVSNKTATSCTPDLAKKTQGGSNANLFSVDVFGSINAPPASSVTALSSSSGDVDDVHNCNDSKPTVSISGPATCTSVSDCLFTVAATQGTKPLSGGTYTDDPAGTLKFTVNGQAASSVAIPSDSGGLYNYTFAYTPTASGPITVQVQAVDSVLYSATSSTTSNVIVSGGGGGTGH